MTRFLVALIAALAGLAFGLWMTGWDLSSGQDLKRLLDDPGSVPRTVWVIAIVAFLLVFVVPALISAARRAAPTARTDTPTPTKASASNSRSSDLSQTLREENPALCVALSSLTLFAVRFFTVPQGWMFTITAFGKCRRIVATGLGNCISLWGLFERVGMAVPQMEQLDTFDKESVFTSDGVNCLIDVMVCYRVVNPEAAVYQVSDYREAIRQLVQAVLRNECGKRSTRNLLSGREEMAGSLRQSLARDVEPWGITVRLVEITNIQIPKDVSRQ